MDGHDPITGEIPVIPDATALPIDIATLKGDLRAAALTWIRQARKPWDKLPEAEQRAVIDSIDRQCEHIIRRAVALLAERDFPVCRVAIGDASVKSSPTNGKAIAAKVATIYTAENMAFLSERVGTFATLVGVDVDEYLGEREPAEADPDQPELPVADNAAATKA